MSAADAASRAAAVRSGVGVFHLPGRGVLRVEGDDRTRWLDGMVSNDVTALAAGPERSGCYALQLTPKGRIVADLHVLWRPDAFWLESDRAALPGLVERLDRYIVADDVRLTDHSAQLERIGIEGPAAAAALERAAGAELSLAPDCGAELEIAGAPVLVAAFGWSGEAAFQLFAPAGSGDAVAKEIGAAAGDAAVQGDAETLEVLRIEAGVPILESELSEDVLPAEAHLDRAISTTKGCYTGQEIVARLRTRGHVNHLLVGVRFPDGELPAPGEALRTEERATGEVTSVCRSSAAGAIGLGFVRREHAEPGTALRAGEHAAVVAPLPFVAGAR